MGELRDKINVNFFSKYVTQIKFHSEVHSKNELPIFFGNEFLCEVFSSEHPYNNGKEFDNLAVRTLLTTHGTTFRLTCPYTSQQNCRAECVLRTLNDCVRTLLFHAHMPPRFWPDALSTASLLLSIRPCRTHGNFANHHLQIGRAHV